MRSTLLPLATSLVLFGLVALPSPSALAQPGARETRTPDVPSCPIVQKVQIVSGIGDGRDADASRKFARVDETVTLYAVVETQELDARGRTLRVRYTTAPLRASRREVVRPWPARCPLTLAWKKLEARPDHYNNARSAAPAEVAYTETSWAEGWEVSADVHPTLMHDEFAHVKTGLGVMRYRVHATSPAGTVSSPGADCRVAGALCKDIHTVAVRPDDTYLGYLHELFNTPYIYGSKRVGRGRHRGHQSDLLLGSDCADFAVYGRRRQKGERRYPYTYTGALARYAKRIARVTLDDQGRYVDEAGEPLRFGDPERATRREVRPGDLINFRDGHVAVLVHDDGDGTLDLDDYVMHTLFREPETVRIRDCRWPGVDGKEVLRW